MDRDVSRLTIGAIDQADGQLEMTQSYSGPVEDAPTWEAPVKAAEPEERPAPAEEPPAAVEEPPAVVEEL